MSDGVDTTLRERLDGDGERLCGRLTGDALDVDLEEDLDRLWERVDGDGGIDICEDARERDLDGGGDPRSECVGEGARDTFETGDASLGVSVGEYAGVDGGGEGEDSMLETSLLL